jgi:serine/threonine-protein phosphatase PP1 catalytic subunit
MTGAIAVDDVLERLLRERANFKRVAPILTQDEILWLCRSAKSVIKKQPVFLDLAPPVTICGDVHGQFFDLVSLFDPPRNPANTVFLFLGDYVDRGPSSLNTISLLFAYKIKYQSTFWLLRGNHEFREQNRMCGFQAECMKAFQNLVVWTKANQCFDWLPIAAQIQGRALCLHGGISRDLRSIDQLKELERPWMDMNWMVRDILWSDPDPNVRYFGPSDRGAGHRFGIVPVQKFLKNNGLQFLVRSHEMVEEGYEFPFNPNKEVVTVFSAPNYLGEGNAAAIMHIEAVGEPSFTVYRSRVPGESSSETEDVEDEQDEDDTGDSSSSSSSSSDDTSSDSESDEKSTDSSSSSPSHSPKREDPGVVKEEQCPRSVAGRAP